MVRETIELTMPNRFWVVAELSECRENRGHCYMELIQKNDSSNALVAKASAKCWKSVWAKVKVHFQQVTGEQLHAGQQILLCVTAQFHELYGFSWIVTDINPEFTLGELAKKRQEIIDTLKKEGVFNLNKELTIPRFTQRIAIISSQTAAGYGDFCNQLLENSYHLRFYTELFSTTMQGDNTEKNLIKSLNDIYRRVADFDVVVIIRGGGSTADLRGFDTLPLAENVANFPLPIITGIGHERDESILDLVANKCVKTPTAAASFLVENLYKVYTTIEEYSKTILMYTSQKCAMERERLNRLSTSLPIIVDKLSLRHEVRLTNLLNKFAHISKQKLLYNSYQLDKLKEKIQPLINNIFIENKFRLDRLTEKIDALDPQHILDKGYSITIDKNGKAIKDKKQIKDGDKLITKLSRGFVTSTVINTSDI